MVKRISTTLLVLLSSTGCSLLIDNSPFLGSDAGVQPDAGGGGDGGRDAGRDAGPNAPTTPEVHIEPAEPRTLDDLSVVIDVESTDPLAAGAITYEHRWLRDAEDTGETGTTIASARTAKGQTWTVEVTPVTADDRRGPPATASVTILNTPPTIRTVGLSSYRPVVDDTLTAFAGSVSDVDGDTVTVRYRWLIDGAAASPTTRQLGLTDATAPAGSEIFVEARAFDGSEESAPVDAGPAIVVANTTRWIQHWPDRGNVELVTYDERHQRIIIGTSRVEGNEPQLWEHDLDTDRFVRLRPTGDAPGFWLYPESGSYDPTTGTVYFLTGQFSGPMELYALHLRERGRERWEQLPLTGDAPPSPPLNGAVLDASRARLYFLSQGSGGTDAELWQVQLSTSGGATSRVADGLAFDLLGGTWVSARGADVAYLLGGGAPIAIDAIHRLDFASATTLEELVTRLPVAAAGLTAASTADGSALIFGYGQSDGSPVDGFWRLDRSSMEITAASAADSRFSMRLASGLFIDDARERLLMYPGRRGFGLGEYELFALPHSLDEVQEVHAFGRHAPPLSHVLAAAVLDDLVLFGGMDRDRSTHGGVWSGSSLGFAGMRRVMTTADPTFGAPVARAEIGISYVGDLLAFFGGTTDGTALADGTTWRLDGTRWVARRLVTTASAPAPRRGASFFDFPVCDGDLGVFGGATASGLTNDVSYMDCSAADAECAWSTPVTSGTPPSPRRDSALLGVSGGFIVLGGLTSSGRVMDAHGLMECPRTWSAMSMTGDVPSPRSGHTITGGILFGGEVAGGYENDAYRITASTASGTVALSRLEPAMDGDGLPEGRTGHGAAYFGAAGGSMFVYGGARTPTLPFRGHGRVLGDLWELRLR